MKKKRLGAFMLALVVLAAGMGVWAVSGEIRIAKLNARIAELEAANVQTQVSLPAGADPDAIAAEFEGGVVTVAEALAEYETIASYYQLMGMTEAEYAEDAKYTVLDGLIENKILENKAKEAGVYELTKAEEAEIEQRVQVEYEDYIRYNMEFRFDESKSEKQLREETIAYMNENGDSYENMLENAKRDAWKEKLFAHVTKDMSVSDEQMRDFYESQVTSAEMTYSANFAEYEMDSEAGRAMVWHPQGVRRVQYILSPFDENQEVDYMVLQAALENGDANAQAQLDALYENLMPKAEEMLSRVQEGGDFAVLMQEYAASGEMPVSAQSTLCGAGFRDAAMALANPGDVSGLVRTDGGVCIIRYAEDVPAGAIAYEDVKDDLMAIYAEELKSSQYNATVMNWISEANAKYYIDRF